MVLIFFPIGRCIYDPLMERPLVVKDLQLKHWSGSHLTEMLPTLTSDGISPITNQFAFGNKLLEQVGGMCYNGTGVLFHRVYLS